MHSRTPRPHSDILVGLGPWSALHSMRTERAESGPGPEEL
jgi:hypothetical protein